jgi:peptidoglycan/LPS O-acetylase OafA/YrhL
MVALHHFRATGYLADNQLVRNSFLFVDFFFVLSVYVIAMNYYGLLGTMQQVRTFFRKRFARLYPLHVATLVPFVLVELLIVPHFPAMRQPFSPPMTPEALGLNLLFLNSVGFTDGLTWNYPSWSIGAEFYTYVGFAAIMIWARRRTDFVLGATILAMLVWLARESPGYIDATHDFGLVRCMLGFAVGVLVWRAMEVDTFNALPAAAWTVAEVIAVAGSLVFVLLAGHSMANLASPFVFALAVAVFSRQRGLISRGLRWPTLVYLGTISYSIYMVHAFVASRLYSSGLEILSDMGGPDLFNSATGKMGVSAWQGDALTISYIAIVLSLASITYAFIEKPGQRLLAGRLGRSAKSSLTATSPSRIVGSRDG